MECVHSYTNFVRALILSNMFSGIMILCIIPCRWHLKMIEPPSKLSKGKRDAHHVNEVEVLVPKSQKLRILLPDIVGPSPFELI